MSELDPKLTFESFVVGPANRLASAAARRAAETPGTSYNPLFLYSKPGLGKTHILTAIAHRAESDRVEYMALEEYLDRLEAGLHSGTGEKGVYGDLDILLLDDVQFLTGQPEAQEMLLKTLDQLTSSEGQIVLASDRPPADINGLDARLLSRFSGGLIVDLGAPEYETRVAIINKKAEERGQTLEPGVAEAVAKAPLKNVRELGGVLNKIFATQDLEDRRVAIEEVAALLEKQDEAAALSSGSDEFGSFLTELTSTVETVVEEKEELWRKTLRDAIETADRRGFSTLRLESLLDSSVEPEGWEEAIRGFKADLQRLHEIDNELNRLGNPWPEAAQGVLEDPDRLEEAEALLTSVRERQRPFPRIADGDQLHDLDDFENIALKAAAQLVGAEKPDYNPLYVWSSDEATAKTLLGAVGRTYQEAYPELAMAVASVPEFASDFIRALGEGVAGAWRERWWTVDLLLVHGIQDLVETERAQDEFFHLFEALRRRGARMMFVGDRAPASISEIDDRMRSRFEGGLVLEASTGTIVPLELVESSDDEHAGSDDAIFVPDLDDGADDGEAGGTSSRPQPVPIEAATQRGGAWFPGPENAVIHWPRFEELLIEELD
ncbi:MAG: ATP-binding protein [Gemmatimonadetes bacterium]|nr:ATP-binding protein [Gemmatimonadota bacterium]NNL30931.1 ATP-binding protein [Gemmatimonadota bacterium]